MNEPRRAPPNTFVSSRSLLAMDQAARAIGIEVDLQKHAPQFDPADASGRIPLEQQISFCRAMFSRKSETLGIDLAANLPLESTGLWGFLLRSSSNFGEMLARGHRYQRIVNVYEEFALEDHGESVAMVCHHPTPSPFGPREQVVFLLLGHWLAWGRQLSGHPIPVTSASFQWSGPRNPAPFQRFFGADVLFGQPDDVIVFPRSHLELPFRESAPELSETFESYANVLVSNLSAAGDPLIETRAAIEDGLLTGRFDEKNVAGALGITTRTLHRRLSSSGTTFRQLKRGVIIGRAKKLLDSAEIPLGEVSYLLGFSEPSSFHRAFRRWTGKTPGEWRGRTGDPKGARGQPDPFESDGRRGTNTS